jgi:FlaA1/EpsC-like NDP-sugar epimerase
MPFFLRSLPSTLKETFLFCRSYSSLLQKISAPAMGKRILVFGATGPLGIYICQEALKHDHQLTVYARSPQKLPKDVIDHEQTKVCFSYLEY